MQWLLRWSTPVILGSIEPSAMDRFWSLHEAGALACVVGATEVRLAVDAHCVVLAVSDDCLASELVGEAIPTPYCGCGVALVTQTLSRARR